jgi:hypothetical protein
MKRNRKKRVTRLPAPATAQRNRARSLDDKLAQFVPFCPLAERNPFECPLYDLRNEKAATIGKWIAGLTVEDKEYLVLYHECCLALKRQDASSRLRERMA